MNNADIKIQWLWPARLAGESNIGFGVHRTRFRLGVVAVVATLLLVASLFFLDAAAGTLLWAGLASVAVTVAMFVANGRHYRYYEVDDHVRPVRALSATPPPEISGRIPTTAGKFLKSGAVR